VVKRSAEHLCFLCRTENADILCLC
jgi:hypothetical protein